MNVIFLVTNFGTFCLLFFILSLQDHCSSILTFSALTKLNKNKYYQNKCPRPENDQNQLKTHAEGVSIDTTSSLLAFFLPFVRCTVAFCLVFLPFTQSNQNQIETFVSSKKLPNTKGVSIDTTFSLLAFFCPLPAPHYPP